MTESPSSVMLNRLRGVEWIGDWDYTMGHVMSRRLLMREYLRRAALWAQAYSAEGEWPFFDVTERIDPEFRLSPEIAAEMEEFLGTVPEWFLRSTCAGAVCTAELRVKNQAQLPDLPDLYEPLVLFYERGGEFVRDNAGFLDLTGVLFRPGTLRGHLGAPPLSTLSDVVLDAVDAEGRISYYAAADGQGPLLRRRELRDEQCDELFSRGLQWEPTEQLPSSEEKVKEAGLVELDETEAANLIGVMVANTSR
ncbi:hypothetical protein [Streptomyces platensis]|uniref:hypothetical protein n=1 Tax=Streptomyces platensis TaxID=58346 RepID=UPI001F18A236|nr:hypothetical protein [Streptomyces platensis]MCF3146247.1 hypothetical protein [Streptomyces platensis]